MRKRDFFEIDGIELPDGVSVTSGNYDPRTPPPEKVTFLSEMADGSVFIYKSGIFFQKRSNVWTDITALAAPEVGQPFVIESGTTLVIGQDRQYNIYVDEFIIDGDLTIEGNGELIVHE